MKGLIIKDFYGLKKVKNMYLILSVIFVAYCFIRGLHNFISMVPILIFSTTITSTFSMDASVKWDKLAVPAPLDKRDIVKSKYILLLIIIGIGILAGTALSLPGLILKEIKPTVCLQMTLFATGIALCSGSLSIVVIYLSKNAIDKMELLTIFSYAGAAIIVIGVGKLLNLANGILNLSKGSVSVISLLVIFIVYIISYKISVNAFTKHDL